MKGVVPRVKLLCPKVLGLTPAKPASSSSQHAAAGQIPNCCSFVIRTIQLTFSMHLPYIHVVLKEMQSPCEEWSDSVLLPGELAPAAASVKKTSISFFLLFVQIFRDSNKSS